MEDKTKDKAKLQEMINELSNLKKYCNELGYNTRGDKLERYINALSKNITLFDNEVENIYNNFRNE